MADVVMGTEQRENICVKLGFNDGNVPRLPSRTLLASVSRTNSLTKPDQSAAAKRFLCWRKKNWKPLKRKPKFVQYWKSRKPVR